MQLPPTRASAAILSLVDDFTGDAVSHAAADALLSGFDQAGWWTNGYSIADAAGGQLITLRFDASTALASFSVPGLPIIARISLIAEQGRTSLQVLRDAGGRWLQIGDLNAAIEFSTSLLQPADGSANAVHIDAALAVRIDRQGHLELRPRASLSLPWSRVAGLPIELRMEGLQFDLRTDHTPPELAALEYDASSLGIYAVSADLRLFPELRFGAGRGIVLHADSLALGSRGLSAKLGYYWFLEHDGVSIGPASQLTATLIDELAVAFDRVELSIRDNLPEHFLARGVLQLPFLPALLGVQLELQVRPGGARLNAQVDSMATMHCDFGAAGHLDIGRLSLSGDVEADRFTLEGRFEQVALVLGPLSLSVASAEGKLDQNASSKELRLRLGEVDLGPLGVVPNVELNARERSVDGGTEREFYLAAQLAWQDLRSRIHLPDNLPVPADDASVSVKITAHDGTSGAEMTLDLTVEVSDFTSFGEWLPVQIRPEVRNASLVLSITYAAGDFATEDSAGQLAVNAAGAMEMRLPDLSLGSVRDLLHVTTGDANGWVRASFNAGVNAAGEPFFDVAISDALSIDIQLPGLSQGVPPISATIDSLELLIQGAGVVEGEIVLAGRLQLRSIAPPSSIPIAQHVERMFASVGLSEVSGECTLSLRFRDDKVMASLEASFDDASIKIDLFNVVADLAAGLGVRGDGNAVRISLEAGVALSGVKVSLGSLEAGAVGFPFAVELITRVSIAGLQADCVFAFSDQEVVLGIRGHEIEPGHWNTDIPLTLPKLPVTVADLDMLAATGWDISVYRERRAQEIAASLGVADLTGESARVARARGQLEAATFLLQQIADLRASLSPDARDTYANFWVRNFVAAVEGLTGWMSNDSDVCLRLEQFSLTLPLADPRNLGIEGTLRIVGFAPGDPLAGLEDITLSAGISADLIYFALEGTGEPIELPGIGRYTGAKVSLGELRIGYGYASNSFNIVVDGTFEPPPALIEDVDTSRELGFGVRLPSRNALYFRLGVIPIPGPIPALPVFDFNLDLRSPNSLALVDADNAVPFWDGLQLIANDLFRVDLKHVAVSPMLGPLPITNIKYDGDWMIGNDDLGFTVIADNVHVLFGIGPIGTLPTPTPIPYFADPTSPYFDNLVLNLRIAGFKLNLNIQRPFPSFNPLAILELFALLSDPTTPINPEGPLANVLRLSVKNVHVSLPPWARQLFPESDAIFAKPGEFTLNVGTALTALQALLSAGIKTLDAVTEAGSSIRRAIDRLPNVVVPDVDTMLAALPPELRKIRLGGALGGFEARAVILLVSPQAALDAIAQRDTRPTAAAPAAYAWGESTRPASGGSVPVALGSRSRRESNPSDPRENLFRGIEFASFSAADLIEVVSGGAAAIVLAAHVKVFEAQRYRFVGVVSSDGSFLLVTTTDVRPLQLRVAGVTVRVPFQASARMRLEGRTRRDGFHGSIHAQGYAHWEPVPGLLSVSIGSKQKPVSLALYSDGDFRARGAAEMRILSARIDGEVDLSNTHCFISGSLDYTAGRVRVGDQIKDLVSLQVDVEGRIGPGASFQVAGGGSLTILDQPFTNVSAVITDRYARASASLNSKAFTDLLTGLFPMSLTAEVSGTIDLGPATRPSFMLAGRMTVQLFDLKIEGAGHIASQGGRGVRVGVEGSLAWGGHAWLGGFLEVGMNGLTVGGRTRFAFPLTHPGTGNAQFANLYCEVNIGGRFSVNADQGLASWSADASCMLGLHLPSPSNQFIPLASYSASGAASGPLRMRILCVAGFEVPGLAEVELLIPKLEDRGSVDIDMVRVGVENILEIRVPYLEGAPGPEPKDWLGFISRSDFMKLPLTEMTGWETITLGKLISNPLTIYLTFRQGALNLELVAGGESVFVPLVGGS